MSMDAATLLQDHLRPSRRSAGRKFTRKPAREYWRIKLKIIVMRLFSRRELANKLYITSSSLLTGASIISPIKYSILAGNINMLTEPYSSVLGSGTTFPNTFVARISGPLALRLLAYHFSVNYVSLCIRSAKV